MFAVKRAAVPHILCYRATYPYIKIGRFLHRAAYPYAVVQRTHISNPLYTQDLWITFRIFLCVYDHILN